jgi:fructosamine-3-kinase
LEYLSPTRPAPDYWPALGERLARLHLVTRERFGFDHDNYLGLTPQPNPAEADGFRFFAEHRLLYLGRRCRDQGRLGAGDMRRLERVAARLPELVPPQPASLLHGDLWSGNIIPGPEGQACLIDPAAHFGWAEADLAMMVLFGSVPRAFYSAYESVRPLAPGYQARFDVYNLYHLLNHLGLFGASYGEAVRAILRRYGGE